MTICAKHADLRDTKQTCAPLCLYEACSAISWQVWQFCIDHVSFCAPVELAHQQLQNASCCSSPCWCCDTSENNSSSSELLRWVHNLLPGTTSKGSDLQPVTCIAINLPLDGRPATAQSHISCWLCTCSMAILAAYGRCKLVH